MKRWILGLVLLLGIVGNAQKKTDIFYNPITLKQVPKHNPTITGGTLRVLKVDKLGNVVYNTEESALLSQDVEPEDEVAIYEPLRKGVKNIYSSTYTLQDEDFDKILQFHNTNPVVITVPLGLLPNGRYEFKQLGTGQLLFAGNFTILRKAASENLATAEQYSVVQIDWIDNNEYMVYGRLELIPE